MEKLILKGVMWGADKVPDTWFDKIPGGFYAPRNENDKPNRTSNGDMARRKKRSNGRSDSEGGHGHDRQRRDDRDSAHGSDGRGRRSRSQHGRPYDGAYDSVNDRPKRAKSGSHRQGNDRSHPRERRPDDERLNGMYSYHDGPVDSPENSATGATAAFVHGASNPWGSTSATDFPERIPPQPAHHRDGGSFSTSTLRGGISTGYVPYADIYGGPTHERHQQYDEPLHFSDTSYAQSDHKKQASAAVAKQQYRQNPFAQEAPFGAQPSYIPDPSNNAGRYDEDSDDPAQAHDYGEPGRRHSRSPIRSRRSRRDHDSRSRSQSRDTYERRDDRRRTRSEHRDHRRHAKSSGGSRRHR